MNEPIQVRSADVAQSEGELSPAVELEYGFVDLRASLDALNDDPENEHLYDASLAKLAHVGRLTTELPLDGDKRAAARNRVLKAARWLAARPAERGRS
jgi:hypothetical protein